MDPYSFLLAKIHQFVGYGKEISIGDIQSGIDVKCIVDEKKRDCSLSCYIFPKNPQQKFIPGFRVIMQSVQKRSLSRYDLPS